ncbi:MAG TPA: metal-dependent hydrolase [Woeseiaceae bacterium]|nr:metal-dependent hydrolase [Woeseiaceae bacterium]
MDSLTQIVLGASVAALAAPPEHRRKALAVGAVLGTLPDLDVLVDYGGAVENFTYHRGFSHSLIVLAPFSVLLWLALRRWWAPVRAAPRPWLAAIALTLLTHPLLDAHTAYGTQLFWPFEPNPVMWGTIFIIDPLYTLPLLATVVYAALRPHALRAGRGLAVALSVSTAYLAWTWVAQGIVAGHAREALAAQGREDVALFVTPTPFNTLLWRVVAMTDDGWLEGFDSLLLDEGRMALRAYPSDSAALASAADDVWAVRRLSWFASGFVRASVHDGELYIADLRMGQYPVFVFTHIVAERGNPHWRPIEAELVSVDFSDRSLGEVWERVWSAPAPTEQEP